MVNLLLSSFGILLLSQAAIALIHAGVPKHLVWQMSSTFWIAITVLASAYNLKNQTVLVEAGMELPRHLNPIQRSALLLVLVLQIVNILLLKAFWPVFNRDHLNTRYRWRKFHNYCFAVPKRTE